MTERHDEVLVLADGIATVEFGSGYGVLEVSYGVPLPPDQFLALAEGVGEACAAAGYDLVHDPQLGHLVALGEPSVREAMTGKWHEGLEIVAELRARAEAEANGDGPRAPKRRRWWRRG